MQISTRARTTQEKHDLRCEDAYEYQDGLGIQETQLDLALIEILVFDTHVVAGNALDRQDLLALSEEACIRWSVGKTDPRSGYISVEFLMNTHKTHTINAQTQVAPPSYYKCQNNYSSRATVVSYNEEDEFPALRLHVYG